MTTIRHSSTFLRRVLITDAAGGAVASVALLVAAGPLAEMLALPAPVLRYVALALLPIVAFIAWLATRPEPPRAGVWALIAINGLWAVESIFLLFSGWVHPNLTGQVFIVAQALVVAGLAELQFIGLRRIVPRAIAA